MAGRVARRTTRGSIRIALFAAVLALGIVGPGALAGDAGSPAPNGDRPLELARLDAAHVGGVRAALDLAPLGPLQPAEYRNITRRGDIVSGPGGIPIRLAPAIDRAASESAQRTLEAVRRELQVAQSVLHEQLGLTRPGSIEVVIARRGGAPVSWLRLPRVDAPQVLVVDAAPGREDVAARQLLRPYTAWVLAGAPEGWRESTIHWVEWHRRGALPAAGAQAASRRLAQLGAGLDRPDAAGGDVVWLGFLSEMYAPAIAGDLLRRLASGEPTLDALAAALEPAGADLEDAFRELHLWAILSGDRDDGHHLPFAAELTEPAFASHETGLPALSLKDNPAVASWGATQVRLSPDETQGGVSLSLEGEFPGTWSADVVIVDDDGTMHRVAVPVDEGRGEVAVPLQSVEEIWLLARRHGDAGEGTLPYSDAAHHRVDYPVAFTALEAATSRYAAGGIDVRWTTESEVDIVAFEVLRSARGGEEQAITPVFVPAMGDARHGTAYHFLDSRADPDLDYDYRIRAITPVGLTALSRPFSVQRN